jgi:hypothetical protein
MEFIEEFGFLQHGPIIPSPQKGQEEREAGTQSKETPKRGCRAAETKRFRLEGVDVSASVPGLAWFFLGHPRSPAGEPIAILATGNARNKASRGADIPVRQMCFMIPADRNVCPTVEKNAGKGLAKNGSCAWKKVRPSREMSV